MGFPPKPPTLNLLNNPKPSEALPELPVEAVPAVVPVPADPPDTTLDKGAIVGGEVGPADKLDLRTREEAVAGGAIAAEGGEDDKRGEVAGFVVDAEFDACCGQPHLAPLAKREEEGGGMSFSSSTKVNSSFSQTPSNVLIGLATTLPFAVIFGGEDEGGVGKVSEIAEEEGEDDIGGKDIALFESSVVSDMMKGFVFELPLKLDLLAWWKAFWNSSEFKVVGGDMDKSAKAFKLADKDEEVGEAGPRLGLRRGIGDTPCVGT